MVAEETTSDLGSGQACTIAVQCYYYCHYLLIIFVTLFITFVYHLWHETVVMSEPVNLGMCVQPANGGTVHIASNKAHTYALSLG